MTRISIRRMTDEAGREALGSGMNSLADRIRERAYRIFQERGSMDGGALDHWLEAERALTIQLESDLVETDGGFELNLAADDLDTSSLGVTASTDALAISGQSGDGDRMLLARFDLPAAIDPEEVTAGLDNGVLRISAQKAGREKTGSAKTAAA